MIDRLNAVAEICLEKLDAIGVPYGKITEFTINTRAKKRWGQCRKCPDGTYKININVALLDKKCIDGLVETLMHEIIHTCPGCMNHGPEWKKWADLVGKEYGYSITRTKSAEELGAYDYKTPARRKRKTTKYSVGAVERFIAEKLIPAGYTVYAINIDDLFDNYICVKGKNFYIYEFKLGGDYISYWYTMRCSRKISKRMEAEINSSVK